MKAFDSTVSEVGTIALPRFSGLRIMMMPFLLEDLESIPKSMGLWRKPLAQLRSMSEVQEGVAYLTIDEAEVEAGTTHRRPGLHVDGIGPDHRPASWGGGGGGTWGNSGMLVAASHYGCRGWDQIFQGEPGANGDCSHLANQCQPEDATQFEGGKVYLCGPLTVHESVVMGQKTNRQFVRLSMPNDCPWYEGYTENPTGVKATGPIHPPRTQFMGYRK